MNRNNGRKIAERLMLLQDYFIKNADKTHAACFWGRFLFPTVLFSTRSALSGG